MADLNAGPHQDIWKQRQRASHSNTQLLGIDRLLGDDMNRTYRTAEPVLRFCGRQPAHCRLTESMDALKSRNHFKMPVRGALRKQRVGSPDIRYLLGEGKGRCGSAKKFAKRWPERGAISGQQPLRFTRGIEAISKAEMDLAFIVAACALQNSSASL